MSLTSVKKELKTYTHEQLIELIADLYKAKQLSTREYLEFMLNPDEEKLYDHTLSTIARELARIKRGYAHFRSTRIRKELQRFDAFGTSATLCIEIRIATLRSICLLAVDWHFGNPQGNFAIRLLDDTLALADRNLMLATYLPQIDSAIRPKGYGRRNKWIFTDLHQAFENYDTTTTLP